MCAHAHTNMFKLTATYMYVCLRYYELLEQLQENVEEYEELQKLAGAVLLHCSSIILHALCLVPAPVM